MKGLLPFAYILLGLFIFGVLHASHNYSFKPLESLNSKIIETQELQLTHILGEGCGCSEFVGEYLSKRGRVENEEIIAIGTIPGIKELEEKGFNIKSFKQNDPALEGIEGVPLFIVSQDRKVLYSGGYSTQMLTRNSVMKDLEILDRIKDGHKQTPLPIFGCAKSKKLQRYFDPLGFKY